MSLIIDNKIIETPIKDLLELLRQQLAVNHSDKLDRIDYRQNDARISCPFHAGHGEGGRERTPSCDILLEDKGDLPAGTVHCFGCGYRASFTRFVADCLNINYRKAIEWITGVSRYSLIETTRYVPELDINKTVSNKILGELPNVTLDELKSYDYIHPYMFQRKLTDDIIDKFEVGYDPKLDALTFPVYVDGVCKFVAKRRVKFKRFDMPKLNSKPIYGLDYIKGDEVIVCESVIDALTCWTYGKEAIALFGTGSDNQIDALNKIRQRKIVIATDGDEAGNKAANKIAKRLTSKIVMRMALPEGRDINDLTVDEFNEIYNNQEII